MAVCVLEIELYFDFMDQQPKSSPTTSEPTDKSEQMPQEPVSVHHNAAAHWSMVAAAIGIPVLVLLVVAGLFLLPEPSSDDDVEGRQQNQQNNNSGRNNDDRDDNQDVSTNPTKPQREMNLMTVADAEARGAICNDGSPAKYYFRPGTEADKDKWIIYFQGGGGCGSEEACIIRAAEDDPGLMSSEQYAQTTGGGGILSADDKNADFNTWNQVKLMYCSSDTWSGNAEQIIAGETWYFHGKTIAEAIIADLQNPDVIKTSNLSSATEVIVAGSSAGGGGASHNIDDIAKELSSAEVKGFIDSSWGYEIENPFVASGEFEARDRTEIGDFNNKQLDDTCVAANSDDPGVCTFLSSVYPYLETPTFIFMNQYDQLKLGNLGVKQPFDAAEQSWLETEYIPGLLASYEIIEDGLFSPRQTFHTMLTSERYFGTKIGNVTIQEAFTNWYFNRPGDTYLIEGI